jgi:hypothetical protein
MYLVLAGSTHVPCALARLPHQTVSSYCPNLLDRSPRGKRGPYSQPLIRNIVFGRGLGFTAGRQLRPLPRNCTR